ncbi:MAG: hypothetical protein HZC25_07500 [Rhodospirillales bacterium]|nr:hypothetical protein [Rhodospirillales bacterium]
MKILGLSFDYHDSAAALLVDGRLVAAAEEERFSRHKHDSRFPRNAIAFALAEADLQPADLDAVVFYEDTLLKLDRIVSSYLGRVDQAPDYLFSVLNLWSAAGKMDVEGRLARHFGLAPSFFHRIGHHQAHAASAFFPSPFAEAAIVTMDGVGEYDTTVVSRGHGTTIERLYASRLPQSLGLLYSAFTAFLGFEVNEGEYKVMGMAGFGQPRFLEAIRALVTLSDDGLFAIDQSYFLFECPKDRPYSDRLIERFGPPRPPESPFRMAPAGTTPAPGSIEARSAHYADIACSLQRVVEEIILHVVGGAMRRTGLMDVCIAGGVGLNSLANARLKRELGCRLFVQPAAGDSGGALGAALHHWHQTLEKPRSAPFVSAYLGKAYDDTAIGHALARHRMRVHQFDDDESLIDATVDLLEDGRVVGWMQGRFEWGPRALGNRSILANPTRPDMQAMVNVKIKFREPFRPFAPSVLAEHAHVFFEIDPDLPPWSPEHFMLAVGRVRPFAQGLIPAVTHVDGTARIQLVRPEINPLYYKLIAAFGRRTGVPVLLNTSFNLRGEAMVDKPYDALETFTWSEMDALVMGRFLLLKENQPCAPW